MSGNPQSLPGPPLLFDPITLVGIQGDGLSQAGGEWRNKLTITKADLSSEGWGMVKEYGAPRVKAFHWPKCEGQAS